MKRFWKEVTVEGGAILLDGRPVKTPAKATLILPTEALARAVAAEWAGQGETIRPDQMPLTRYANSALDRVAPQRQAVIDNVAGYGGSDLTCYRAARPQALVDRQAAAWDPLLDWAAERYDARLVLIEGIMPQDQPPQSRAALRNVVATYSNFALAALHELTALSGSLVIGLAVAEGHLDPKTGWALSRIDEDFQIEQWGEDADAAEMAARKRVEFLDAARLNALLVG